MGLGIYYNGYVTKNLRMYSLNPPYLLVNRIDGFIEEKERDKYLKITSTDRNSEALTLVCMKYSSKVFA